MNYSFGNWIKIRRKALDLTQKELADLVGCSTSMIFKIESEQRRPSSQIAELIAQHLEIPPNQHKTFLDIARQKKNITHLEQFVPLPTIDLSSELKSGQRQLPSSPTPLIGREHEIRMITTQLLAPECRMLTLTGPGGIGKTRLAIEAGKQLEPHFSDGVVFITLAGVERIESILPEIAEAAGVSFSGNAPPILQINNYLRSKNHLLVIDNMEHLVEGSSILGEILQNTEHIKMILTSREHLNVQWEWLFEIKGLPIPERVTSNVENNSAVKLFIQRAHQNSRDFSINEEVLKAVIKICQLVEGSPLAIELAASWVRMLSCMEIAHELEHNLDLLKANKPDIPQRHRSIKSVFEHSWKLLTKEEQTLLMKLSVFQGGFKREAAVTIADASLGNLSLLENKSLLHYNKELDRYELHELIRQYSYVKLQNQKEKESITTEKHAEYYANWIAKLEDPLKSERQRKTSKLISSESSNWLTGFQWMIRNQRIDMVKQMLPCSSWYFEIHGYFDDALSISKSALEEFRTLGAPDVLKSNKDKSAFASLLNLVGWFEFRKGNVKVGSALFSESMEIAQEYGDAEILFYLHANLGYISNFTGNFVEAVRLSKESFKYSQQLKSWHRAVSSTTLGIAFYNLGQLSEAHQKLSKSLDLWRSVGDPRGLCYCFLHLSLVTFTLNDIAKTESIIEESNQIAASNQDWWSYAFGLDMLGVVSLSQGKYEEALAYLEEAKLRMNNIGDRYSFLHILIHIGQVYAAIGTPEEAKQLLQDVYAEAYQANWAPIILDVLISLVEMNCELSDVDKIEVTFSVLSHPSITPMIQSRAERIKAEYKTKHTKNQLETTGEKEDVFNAEDWARKFFEM